MAITGIDRDYGNSVSIVRITTSDTLSTASATDYILNQLANIEALNNGVFSWLVSDMVLVYASNGWMFATISSDFNSLIPFAFSTTVIGTPVVVGDFAVYSSTSGNLEDLGYVPSNPSLTVVTMQNGAAVVGDIPVYNDVTGTLIDSGVSLAGTGQKVTISLTASQFNGMYATPVEVLAAPAAGSLNVVEKAYLVQTYGTTQFTAGGAIQIQYEATAHGAGVAASTSLAAATLNAATASTVWELIGPNSIVFAAAEAAPLYISNATQAFATGDSTFSLIVFYHVIAI
jgi:hypothetical protein